MASRQIKGITIEIGGDTTPLNKALKKSEDETRQLTKEMREINGALRVNPQSLELLSEKSKIAEDKVKALAETLRILKEQQEHVNSGMAKNADGSAVSAEQIKQYNREVVVTNAALQTAQRVFDETNEKIKALGGGVSSASDVMAAFEDEVKDVESAAKSAGRETEEFWKAVGSSAAGNLAAEGVRRLARELLDFAEASPKAAIEFESAFAGVEKTVDGTEAELSALRDGIREMALEIPATTTEISRVSAAAGQLGIQTDSILSFTKVMVGLGEATEDLTSEAAAEALAKFANITRMSQGDFGRLGSTVVRLGNTFATTEGQIVPMAQRLASAGTLAGLSEAQIMGLAAAMSSLGIEAEAGGTALSKTMKQIQTAVELGSDDLKDYARVAGMSAAEFTQAWEEDAAGALTRFIAGLSSFKDEGKSAIVMLDELGIKEVRQSDALLRLSGNYGLLEKALADADAAWRDNTALAEETEKRYSTTESQIILMKNALNDLGITAGEAALPAIREFTKGMREFAAENKDEIAELAEGLGGALMFAVENADALKNALLALGTSFAVFKGVDTVNKVSSVLEKAKAAADAAGTSTSGLSAAFGVLGGPAGAGLAAAGVAALTFILLELYEKYPPVISKTAELTKELSKNVAESKKLTDEIDRQRKAHESSVSDIKNEAEANRLLAGEIEELAEAERKAIEAGEGSAANRDFILSKIAQLNEAVPALALAYDAETGALSRTNDEIERNLANREAELEFQAQMEAQLELQRRMVEIKAKLAVLEKERQELENAAPDDSERESRRIIAEQQKKKAIEDSIEAERKLWEELSGLKKEYGAIGEAAKESAGARAEANGEIIESEGELAEAFADTAKAGEEETKALEEEKNRQADIFDSYTKRTQDAFGTIKKDAAVSVDALIGNLEKNQMAIKAWSENLAVLAERGIDDGLLQQLRDAGPEAAATVEGLVKASDDKLRELNTAFRTGGVEARDALNRELGIPLETEFIDKLADEMANNKQVPDAAKIAVQKARAAFDEQVVDSDFREVGRNMDKGAELGINEGLPGVVAAIEGVATAAECAYKKKMMISSPSQVMEGHGADTALGVAKGIEKKAGDVAAAGKALAEGFVSATYSALTKDKARLEREIEEIGLWPAKAVRASKKELEEQLKDIEEKLKEKRDDFIRYGEAVTQAVKNQAKERYEQEKAALGDELKAYKDVKYDEKGLLESFCSDSEWLNKDNFELLKDLNEQKVRFISQGYIDEIALIDEKAAAALTGINGEIDAELEKLFITNRGLYEEIAAIREKKAELDAAHEKELKRREEEAEAKRIAELNERIWAAETDEQRRSAMEALDDYMRQLDERRGDEKYRAESARLDAEEKELIKSAEAVAAEKKRIEEDAAKKASEILSDSEKAQYDVLTKDYEQEVQNAAQAAVEIVKQGPEAAKAVLEAYNPDWATAGKSFIEHFEAGTKEMEPEAVGAFYDLGDNVIKGFLEGIKSREAEVYAKMQSLMVMANEVARATAGVASPSTKFREIGWYVGQGFEYGLLDAAPLIDRAARKLGMASIYGVQEVTQNAGDIMNASSVANSVTNNTSNTNNRGGDIYITIENADMGSGRDIRDLSEELAFYIKQGMRGEGA